MRAMDGAALPDMGMWWGRGEAEASGASSLASEWEVFLPTHTFCNSGIWAYHTVYSTELKALGVLQSHSLLACT